MVMVPSLARERDLWRQGRPRVVGVDEAGLGPLAGPVVAAACLVPTGCDAIEGVRDSKTLSPSQRERLYGEILRQAAAVGVGAASVHEIEILNVLAASRLAMRRALARVSPYDHVLVDGREFRDPTLGPHTAIIDGDALCYSIACASIIAKVTRDRLMKKLAALYPVYGWDHNAGYGSPGHLEALRAAGPTPFHRRTFAPIRALTFPDLFAGWAPGLTEDGSEPTSARQPSGSGLDGVSP